MALSFSKPRPSVRGVTSLFVIYVAVSCSMGTVATNTGTYDCNAGCDTKYKPVCGADGIVYTNQCLAYCQDIDVTNNGVCADDKGGPQGLSSTTAPGRYRQDGKVTTAIMTQFAADGYTYQSFQSLSAAAPEGSTPQVKAITLDKSPDSPSASTKRNNQAVIITPEGHVYVQSPDKMAVQARSGPSHSAPMAPMVADSSILQQAVADSSNVTAVADEPSNRRGLHVNDAAAANEDSEHDEGEDERKLVVFGTDGRYKVSSTTTYPYSVVGQLSFSMDGLSYICTATVISRYAILTAGHCVYGNGKWASNFKFSPGKQGSYYPYGTWSSWSKASTFSSWMSSSSYSYDMAVITFKPNSSGYYLGDALGYLGFSTTCAWPSVTTTGYPGDKYSGIYMYKQANCPNVAHSCTSGASTYEVAKTNCDTAGGQSGSPVYSSSTHYIYGVHSHSVKTGSNYLPDSYYGASYYSGHCTMTTSKFSSVYSWSQTL